MEKIKVLGNEVKQQTKILKRICDFEIVYDLFQEDMFYL